MDLISQQLQYRFAKEEKVGIDKVNENISLFDSVIGLKTDLSTNYRRNRHLDSKFEFIKAERMLIKKDEKVVGFFYYLPIRKTLKRLLSDDSLRRFLIHNAINTTEKV